MVYDITSLRNSEGETKRWPRTAGPVGGMKGVTR
jgi:hypothetical protein